MICPMCEGRIESGPLPECSAAATHKAAALELGRVGLLLAELRAALDDAQQTAERLREQKETGR